MDGELAALDPRPGHGDQDTVRGRHLVERATLLRQRRATAEERTGDDAVRAQNAPAATLHLHDIVRMGDVTKRLTVDIATSGPDV
jgi:hypothetical protein